jgi:hypothetical protein
MNKKYILVKRIMRKYYYKPENDYRKDNIIKKEIFDNYLKDVYNILFVYDDRNQVVNMWRELGIKTFQVEPGNF